MSDPMEHIEAGMHACIWAADHLAQDASEAEEEIIDREGDTPEAWDDFREALSEAHDHLMIAWNALAKARSGQ